MSGSQSKITRQAKKSESTHNKEKKNHRMGTYPEITQLVELVDKGLKQLLYINSICSGKWRRTRRAW